MEEHSLFSFCLCVFFPLSRSSTGKGDWWRKRDAQKIHVISPSFTLSFLLSPLLLRSHFLSLCLQKYEGQIKRKQREVGGRNERGNEEGMEERNTQTVFTLLLNRANQHEDKTLQFPIPKSNKHSLKPRCPRSSHKSLPQIPFHGNTHISHQDGNQT